MKLSLPLIWIIFILVRGSIALFLDNMLDVRYWRCVYKRSFACPNEDIRYYLYTSGSKVRKQIDVRMTSTQLKRTGWDPHRNNVILIHGFNGTVDREPLTFIKKAYLSRGDYNVVLVDWGDLTRFPCYLTALSNTKLVAQCTAQIYAFLNANGAPREKLLCVGHSLGAHVCGMMSNHLNKKQDKIIGLDPARPLIDRFADRSFKLSPDDAKNVQVIHTNAGYLGAEAPMGHVDFCVNGGRVQPSCAKNFNPLRPVQSERCSHFQSSCFFASTITQPDRYVGVPCARQCAPRGSRKIYKRKGLPVVMGQYTPTSARGTYCVRIMHEQNCPFFL